MTDFPPHILDMVETLRLTYKTECLATKFPREGCLTILKGFGKAAEGFIPDLDMYLYGVASPWSATRKIVKYDRASLLDLKAEFSITFLDKYPQYAKFMERMNQTDTPDLYLEMEMTERARLQLIDLVDALLSLPGNCGDELGG